MTGDRPGDSLPVVEGYADAAGRSGGEGATDHPAASGEAPRVAGVLLAAGTSSRFGAANKLLADVGGTAMVARAARSLAAASLSPLVVVVGHEADRVAAAVDGLGFAVVENDDYARGQSTSVAAGVRAVGDVDAAVVALGDMPAVAPGSVAALVAAFHDGAGTALAAACDGRRGNPVLFARTHFGALADVAGDVGGQEILLAAPDSALVETGDPGVLRDVDTPGDLSSVT
jgi:molybdenum cofactor cytidylyltransferase